MFVPGIYREPDGVWAIDTIRSNPFALLVTATGEASGVHATHVPIIVDPDLPESPDELILLGHMNRANPHWRAVVDDEALAVFSGPNAYVSPTIYRTNPAAPTWDYTAVHARGAVSRIDQGEHTLAVVQSTVRALEGRFGGGWDMSGSESYFRTLLPAVGAFRIHVRCTESIFKLSQEQPPEVCERVRAAFCRSPVGRRGEVAELISRWNASM